MLLGSHAPHHTLLTTSAQRPDSRAPLGLSERGGNTQDALRSWHAGQAVPGARDSPPWVPIPHTPGGLPPHPTPTSEETGTVSACGRPPVLTAPGLEQAAGTDRWTQQRMQGFMAPRPQAVPHAALYL